MNEVDVAERIEAFIREEFKVNANDPRFDRSTDVFEYGYVDSVGFRVLLTLVREEYGVEIPEKDLFSDEFTTIDGMASIIARLAVG